jgi:hypothetical protein
MLTMTWIFWANFWLSLLVPPKPVLLPVPPPPRGSRVTDLALWRRDHPRRAA